LGNPFTIIVHIAQDGTPFRISFVVGKKRDLGQPITKKWALYSQITPKVGADV
jgi:hypothetical protein